MAYCSAPPFRKRSLHQVRIRPPRHPRPLPGMRYNFCEDEAMTRLRRIIFNALTVLSLLLCVATIWMWVRSYQIADWWERSDGYGNETNDFWTVTLATSRGGVEVVSDYHLQGWGMFSGAPFGVLM